MYFGFDAVLERWLGVVTRFAFWVVLLFLVVAAAGLHYTVKNLGINTDTANMLSAELPFRQTHERYKRAFPQYVDTLLLVIEGHTPEQARRAAKTLGARLEDKTDLFKTVYLPGVEPFFESHGLLYLSTTELEALADNLARIQPFLTKLTEDRSLRGLFAMLEGALNAVREGETIDLAPVIRRIDRAIKAVLSGEYYRLSWQRLMRDDETDAVARQFIVVQPRLDYGKWLAGGPAIEAVRDLALDLDWVATPGVNLRITGEVALDYEELQSVTRGAGLAGLLALGMVLMVLSWGLRSLRLVLATLFSLMLGLILTAAFATATIGHLNLISVAFAVLYIGLGIDFLIHLDLRYRTSRNAGKSSLSALQETVRDIGPSLLLCAVTTAVGFYAFIPTAYVGVSELGLIAGTGMFISLLVSLTFLPALLHLWPPSPTQGKSLSIRLPDTWVEFPLRHGKMIRRSAVILALGALLLLPQVRFDYNPLNLQPNSESVSTFKELLADSETPPWNLSVLASSAELARDYENRLQSLPVVDRVVTLQDFIPEEQEEKLVIIENMAFILGPQLNRVSEKAPPTLEEQRVAIQRMLVTLDTYIKADKPLPGKEEAAALRNQLQRLLQALQELTPPAQRELVNRLEQALLAMLPESLEMLRASLEAEPIDKENLPTSLKERWVSTEGIYRVAVYPAENLDDNVALRRFVTAARKVAPTATDMPVLMLEAGDAVVTAFQQAFLIALVAIAVLLILLLKSLIDTAMVLLPLLLAGLLTGAVVILLGVPFNFANIIALPLLLGIGVDNGIHMMHRMRNATGLPMDLLRTSTVRAIFYSALTTIVSFGNLSFSPHQGTASMGQILTIGVLLTLIATIVVLPALWEIRQRWFPTSPGVKHFSPAVIDQKSPRG